MTTHHFRRALLALMRLEERDVPASISGGNIGYAISTRLLGTTVSFESAQVSVTEEQGAAVVSVVLRQPVSYRVDVSYFTDSPPGFNAATPGSDYLPIPPDAKTLTFMPGQTRQTITVPIRWDTVAEADESLTVKLGAATANGPVTVLPIAAQVTIQDSPRDPSRTVAVDSAWLNNANNRVRPTDPASPYKLSLAGRIYILDSDVSLPATAFVATAKDVTLDLNWHTITYDSADFNNDGVIDPLAVPNGGFEVPLANDPTKPAQWDLTGAPLARLVASRTGMWGSSALRLDNVTAAQRLISAPIDLATDSAGRAIAREHAVTVTPKSDRGDVTVLVSVIDDITGAVVASASVNAGETSRGYSPVVQFVPGAGTTRVRVRIDVTPQGATPASVDLDGAALTGSRAFGVVATRGYGPLPADVRSIPGYTAAANFTLRNGSVNQGAGQSYRSNPLFFQSLPGVTVDRVNTVATGMDTDNLSGDYGSDIAVCNSTFAANIQRLSRRTIGFGAIHLNNTQGGVVVTNNEVIGVPMYGVYVASADNTTPAVTQTFDVAGPLVTSWKQMDSSGSGPFLAGTAVKPVASTSGMALVFDPVGDATRSGWTWSAAPVDANSADAEVSAAVYVNSTAPSLVLARGSNLDTAAASFYAAAVAKTSDGRLAVRLLKVVNGVETALPVDDLTPTVAAVMSPDAFADGWVRVTLDAYGSSLRVQVQRLDTSAYLKVTVNASAGTVTSRWATGENDSWAIQTMDGVGLPGSGKLAGVGRRGGDTVKGYFDNFVASRYASTPVQIDDNRIRQRAIVTDGYGILVNGVTNFEVVRNTIQPVNGRGLLIEGADPSNPTRHGTIADNWVEAREAANLEYAANQLEATALRVRNFDAQFRDLVFTRNTFTAETGPGGVWSAIGARVSLLNDIGQATSAGVRFVGNTFQAITRTSDSTFQATAVSVTGAGAGAGLEFWDNRMESNNRVLVLGDRSDGYGSPVRDVLVVGTQYRRPPDAPVRQDFRAALVGEGANAVSSVQLIDWSSVDESALRPLFVGSQLKEVGVGRLVTVAVRQAMGVPVAGATVRIDGNDGRMVYVGTTDAAGSVEAPVMLVDYRQDGSNPLSTRVIPVGPFRVTVTLTSGGTRVVEGLSFDSVTTVPILV